MGLSSWFYPNKLKVTIWCIIRSRPQKGLAYLTRLAHLNNI